MLGNKDEYDRMAEAEGKHWWYITLHERVIKAIQKQFPGNKTISILDAGCGTGGLLIFLRNNGFSNLRGFDVSEFAEEACKRKNLDVFKASLTEVSAHFEPETMDVISCCDALYFLNLEDQKKTLEDFHNILKPGGILLLNLPSLKIFRGTHDISVGIRERYHHKKLKELLPEEAVKNGFSYKYWPVLISPVIAVIRTYQRMKIRSGHYRVESDIKLPVSFINWILKGLMRLEMNLPQVIVFGSSLFVVVKKGK